MPPNGAPAGRAKTRKWGISRKETPAIPKEIERFHNTIAWLLACT